MEQYLRHNILWYDLGCQLNTVSLSYIITFILYLTFFRIYYKTLMVKINTKTICKLRNSSMIIPKYFECSRFAKNMLIKNPYIFSNSINYQAQVFV